MLVWSRRNLSPVLTLLIAVGFAACGGDEFDARGKGIELTANAVHLYGNETVTARPATVDWDALRKATPEHKTIRGEGVRTGSARHDLLVSKMLRRISLACEAMAQSEGFDCVVRSVDVANDYDIETTDCTKAVLRLLDRVDPR